MNFNYLFHLIIKKIKVTVHSKFEKKVESEAISDFDSFIFLLIKEIYTNLFVYKKGGIYYKTIISKDGAPLILGQTRLICLLCDGLSKKDFPIQDRGLIEKLTDFLLTMKTEDNIYEFNNYKWEVQDEGIASVWAGIALIKTYECLNKPIYLDESLSVFNSIFENLYSHKTGLVHTKGQDFWCLNASAQLAYFCSILLKYTYSEEILNVMINSINICIDNIGDDGHFPYSERYQNTYILLYHPNVMFFLNECLNSNLLNEEIKSKILDTNKKGLLYLIKCLDSSFRFYERDIKQYNYYVITAVTALNAIKEKINTKDELNILNNIFKFYNNNKLYLFIDNNNFLFNGKRYKFRDIAITETLYWIVQYKYS